MPSGHTQVRRTVAWSTHGHRVPGLARSCAPRARTVRRVARDPARARRTLVGNAVATLNPGAFAFVMATGIVSVAMAHQHLDVLSAALLVLAITGYAVLVVATLHRVLAHRRALGADLVHPGRAFGFFTFVAATNVLGTRLALDGRHRIALGLLLTGWVSRLVLGYLVPAATMLRRTERPVISQADGSWFVWVVATQSVAVLAATLEPSTTAWRNAVALLALFCWALGTFLYAAIGILVAARLLLHRVSPAELTPSYWVAMGATAISTTAAAEIMTMADVPSVAAARGLVAGTALTFWAFGSWLIPVLVAAGWWRHVRHRVPLRYDATVWVVIFPLGMYGVASHSLGEAAHLPIVTAIGAAQAWVALVAWAITFVAMLVCLAQALLRARSPVDGDATGAGGPDVPRA